MSRRRFPLALAGVIACSGFLLATAPLPAPADEPKPDKDGFVSLFDGKDLDGWKVGANPESWSVKDGMIVVHGKTSHLFYEGPVHNHDWKNFHFKAMVMTFPKANSGIYFHTTFQESGFPSKGFECQVNATHTDPKKSGGLYGIADSYDAHHKDNEWFLYEIIVQGNHVTLKINGVTTTDWTQPATAARATSAPATSGPSTRRGRGRGGVRKVIDHGTFALQGHDPNSEVHYKDIMVKALD